MEVLSETSRVWPSAGALTTASVPRMPAAPARLSMTTGWPTRLARASPMVRAMMSVAPPALKGTTTRMGLVGHAAGLPACARALVAPVASRLVPPMAASP